MAPFSSVARHLLSLRNSTSYFVNHHPCRPEHLVSCSSLDGFRSQAQTESPKCWYQPASLRAFSSGTRELLIAHRKQEPGDSSKDRRAPAGLHALCTQMLDTAPQPQLHNLQWQRHANNGGARKIIEQQEADEKEQAQLKTKQTKFDRSLGARKAKTAEHQSVIAHMSDVRTPRSLLNKSQQQMWEVECLLPAAQFGELVDQWQHTHVHAYTHSHIHIHKRWSARLQWVTLCLLMMSKC